MKKYEGVLKRVRDVEKKNGIVYAKPDGKLYITLKVLYSILGVWTFFMNLFYVLGFLLMYSGTDEMKTVANSLITVSVCTGVLILGYVLNCCKLYLAGGIVSVAPSVFLIVVFGHLLEDSLGFMGFKISFYWRHLGPLVLMILFIVIMTVIAVRANIKLDRQYKRVTENLFNMYNIDPESGNELTEEQWDEFLKNYDPNEYRKQFKKQTENQIEE